MNVVEDVGSLFRTLPGPTTVDRRPLVGTWQGPLFLPCVESPWAVRWKHLDPSGPQIPEPRPGGRGSRTVKKRTSTEKCRKGAPPHWKPNKPTIRPLGVCSVSHTRVCVSVTACHRNVLPPRNIVYCPSSSTRESLRHYGVLDPKEEERWDGKS